MFDDPQDNVQIIALLLMSVWSLIIARPLQRIYCSMFGRGVSKRALLEFELLGLPGGPVILSGLCLAGAVLVVATG